MTLNESGTYRSALLPDRTVAPGSFGLREVSSGDYATIVGLCARIVLDRSAALIRIQAGRTNESRLQLLANGFDFACSGPRVAGRGVYVESGVGRPVAIVENGGLAYDELRTLFDSGATAPTWGGSPLPEHHQNSRRDRLNDPGMRREAPCPQISLPRSRLSRCCPSEAEVRCGRSPADDPSWA